MTVDICTTEQEFAGGYWRQRYLRDQPVRGVVADMLPGEFPRACRTEWDLMRRMLSLHAAYPRHMSLTMNTDTKIEFVEEGETYDY